MFFRLIWPWSMVSDCMSILIGWSSQDENSKGPNKAVGAYHPTPYNTLSWFILAFYSFQNKNKNLKNLKIWIESLPWLRLARGALRSLFTKDQPLDHCALTPWHTIAPLTHIIIIIIIIANVVLIIVIVPVDCPRPNLPWTTKPF